MIVMNKACKDRLDQDIAKLKVMMSFPFVEDCYEITEEITREGQRLLAIALENVKKNIDD